VWTAFGALAFLGDVVLHHTVEAVPWLEERPWLIGGSVLVLAGAFQFSDVKERCLSKCRLPGPYLLAHYRRGPAAGFRLGSGHGLFCVGCCWALMLVMFAAGVAVLWWMAALTAVMVYEKTGRHGAALTPVVGVAMTPRAQAEPGINKWLSSVLPLPDQVGCTVTFRDAATAGMSTREVTLHQLGLQAADIIAILQDGNQQAMSELDDRVVRHAVLNFGPRPDVVPSIACRHLMFCSLSIWLICSAVIGLHLWGVSCGVGQPGRRISSPPSRPAVISIQPSAQSGRLPLATGIDLARTCPLRSA